MNLLQSMLNTVLPVFILAGLGVIARLCLKVEVKDLSRIALYVLSPGLILNSILTTRIVAAEVTRIIGFVWLLTAAMVLVTLLTARLLRWRPAEGSAAVLGTSFINAANYGLPVVLLALGETGFDRGAIFVVGESIMMYTVGVFFAARGQMSWRQALLAVTRLPLLWAAVAGLALRLAGIELPPTLMKPIYFLAQGTIVMVVLLLGMQVAGIRLRGARVKIGVATLLRLMISPVIGLGLVALLQPEPLTAKVLVLQAAMPTAVNTTMLAVEFNAEPDLVSGVTLVTTVASLATVSFWVAFLTG